LLPNSYVGNYRQFIKPFRQGVLTLPWAEDWVWQSPLLSQQGVRRTIMAGGWVAFFQECQQRSCEQVTLLFDVFRSGVRDDNSGPNSLGVWSGSPPIMFYVMPHLGNTPNSWRRQ